MLKFSKEQSHARLRLSSMFLHEHQEAAKTAEMSETTQSLRGPSKVEAGRRISLSVPTELPEELQISCTEYEQIPKGGEPHILLDVRPKK